MPNLIGRVGDQFLCIEVDIEVFKKVVKIAIKFSNNPNDFIDKLIGDIFKEKELFFSEESVISYLKRIENYR